MKNEAYSISATDIEIWARIGLHEKEAFVENCFRISVKINARKPYEKNHYLDYETILDVVKNVFDRPQRLLENICVEIINELKNSINAEIDSIECEIKKVKPAVEAMSVGALEVRIVREF